ncbi:MAG: hypothetical protein UU29_C0019G0007 [Candidatus Daviesbacteria bacterium GW2011_GWA2_40_9]|uniref:Glycosyltransferase RgtA/B/C/D-like domain-containing protein n=1 Tax=Candidatus Daviesbacteria bacterium GW2011_GWA2_40_9 TaxID=1618424 RepID=A0A0G0TYS7_9BACT|nr:MAG: hypothetical protein UU29_C0019G0007 [Candidatus Daviesbacteria bacterium GW2011_GWA2_40_9]
MLKSGYLEIIIITFSLIFSFWLMFHTFSDSQGTMQIATKAWSDFSSHIPLIKSFSFGENFPPQYPLFAGPPIHYHFLFYLLVGTLEKVGLRIDWSLNIPSALGFASLLIIIYYFTKKIFNSQAAALLSVIFFLFNGTLSFLYFLRDHPLSLNFFQEIINNQKFPSFGPYDEGLVAAFWNLNIFTNQRHLGLSYGLVLLILWLLLRVKKTIRSGMLIGVSAAMLVYINFAAAGILGLFLGWIFLVKKTSRMPLLLSLFLVTPAVFLLYRLTNLNSMIVFETGYLVRHPLTWQSIVEFWVQNLGLHAILIPIGLILAPRQIKKLLIVPLLLLFLAPNFYRFSSDMINNHKFFNFFIIVGGMFSAYAVNQIGRIRRIGPMCLIGLIFFTTLSGVIDFFPIVNDAEGGLVDYQANPDARYILEHTPRDAVIANSYWFYHPANLVGRPIYSGYTYFTFSYGYNQGKREQEIIDVYRADSPQMLCALLDTYRISHIELSNNPEGYLKPNMHLWNTLPPDYENPTTHLKIFSTRTLCR